MLTNIFRLGGLQQVSWFQLLPSDGDSAPPIEKSRNFNMHADFVANKVLNAHIRLQNEGHLSAWTYNSMGSLEDASSGSSLTDDSIKLWLFVPGRNESISATVQSAVSGLKVIGTGLWCLPGDGGEVTTALSQALRNRIERALRGVGYIRFGDVFVKCRSFGPPEPQLRKPLPTCEVVFMASEEAIFMQFLLQRKRVRTLSTDDMQAALKLHLDGLADSEERQSVVVAPHGLSGRLTGCCSADLVNELHESKLKAANDHLATGLPLHMVSSSYHGRSTAHGLHAEVYFGHFTNVSAASSSATAGLNTSGNISSDQNSGKSGVITPEKEDGVCLKDSQVLERMLIYPPEAVLVLFVPVIPARTYLKRCWMQSWVGTTWLEDDLHAGLTVASSSSSWRRVRKTDSNERLNGMGIGTNVSQGIKSSSSKSSSGSSSSSSGGSSIKYSSSHGSSSSSESDGEVGVGPGELEADAESLVLKGNLLTGIASSKQAQLSVGQPANDGLDDIKGLEEMIKWGRSAGTSLGEAPVAKVARKSNSSGGEVSNDALRSVHNRTDGNISGMGLSSNMGVGTPKASSSQVGTPWDWPEDDRGLSMDMQNDADILAEFGDFGDFFEDDGLGFGEPPGTAESQAMMFSLGDCVEGIASPGTGGCLDFSDQMLLPILDIPALEGFGQQPLIVKDEKLQGIITGFQKDFLQSMKSPALPLDTLGGAADSLPKLEAMVLFAPGYDPVSIPNAQDLFQNSLIFKSPYVPESRKAHADSLGGSELYVYSATPPPSPKVEGSENKREHYDNISDRELRYSKRIKGCDGWNDMVKYMKGKTLTSVQGVSGKNVIDTALPLGGKMSNLQDLKPAAWSNFGSFKTGGCTYGQKKGDSNAIILGRSATTMLATDLECFLLQLSVVRWRDTHLCRNSGLLGLGKSTVGSAKDRSSDAVQAADSSSSGKLSARQLQERKKKDRIPSRIAGDIDEEVHDGPRISQVGVWRSVVTPKPQRPANTLWNDNTQSSSVTTAADSGSSLIQETATSNSKLNHWQELLDAIPLLIQQGSVSFDVAFDGDCGDGPFGWLISQEQERRKSVCGPGMSHAGCGGMLCASHFLDNSGVELLDPLASEVSAASVAALLQSDMRVAMATAFGDAHLDGPLSLAEWLRGRVLLGDLLVGDSLPSDSKETASTVTVAVGEPITPPQCTTGGPAGLKVSLQDVESQACDAQRSSSSWAMEGSSLSDDGCTRRSGQEVGCTDCDTQTSNSRCGPTVVALPMPSLLVGYQDDWLKISSSTLHLWEKAPLEPYAMAKPVTYYVVCPRIDSLLCATADYMQQLSAMYEACRLGTHVAGNMVAGQAGLTLATGKHVLSGFVAVDFPNQTPQATLCSNTAGSLSDYVTTISKTWNVADFRKALRKACKTLPVTASTALQREPENGPCLVYYVICPSSEPAAVLQTMLDACQSIGSNLAASDKERRAAISSQIQRSVSGMGFVEDSPNVAAHGIVGFSTSKLVLQVLTAETVFKSSSPVSMELDSLKEVAFTVYNKVRRLPRTCSSSDCSLQNTQVGRNRSVALQTSTTMPGMWKDCGTNRSSGANTTLLTQDSLLESSSFRSNSWDNPWQQQGTINDGSVPSGVDGLVSHDAARYLFEPLFILAEPGLPDQGMGMSLSRTAGLEEAAGSGQLGLQETMPSAAGESSEFDIAGGGTQKVANFHCCYGWTEDWQWLISVWTDARGELLDVHLFPMVGNSGRWDTKGLHSLFVQVLLHGCQLLSMATGAGNARPRSMVITRIGTFYELEYQEWQKAIWTVGGSELRKWPVQIWHQPSEGGTTGGSNSSLQPQDMTTLSERTLGLASSGPSSPGPSSSVFSSRNKSSNFTKNDIGSSTTRKLGGGGQGQNENYRGAFQMVQSISFVNVLLEHSLQLVGLSDLASHSGGSQNAHSTSSWLGSNSANTFTALGTGVGLVKTLASTSASYLFVPSHGLQFIPPLPLQLPACFTSESPPLAQVLQKKGLASTVASAFIVSRATPSFRTELMQKSMEEWPSTLHIGLVGHMGNSTNMNTQRGSGTTLGNDIALKAKAARSMQIEGRDQAADAHLVLEVVAAELQALSWLTVSPTFPSRRSALPFHCHLLQRLRRLLRYADGEFGVLQEQ